VSPRQECEQDGWREPGDAQQQQCNNGWWRRWVNEWQIAAISGGSSPVYGERKVDIIISSQTLYGTINGTIGSILRLCGKTYAFLAALQRAMDAIVKTVGDLSHAHYRAWRRDETRHGACGFVDGDGIEKFLDLDRPTMDRVVGEMNADPRWSTCNNGKGFGTRDNVRQTLINTDEGMGANPPSLASDIRTLSVKKLSMLH
jgi:DNA damage-binding protein 1